MHPAAYPPTKELCKVEAQAPSILFLTVSTGFVAIALAPENSFFAGPAIRLKARCARVGLGTSTTVLVCTTKVVFFICRVSAVKDSFFHLHSGPGS